MTDDIRLAALACKRVLVRLKTLSDAPASSIREDITESSTGTLGLRTRERQGFGVKSGRYAESQVPAGVNFEADGQHAPSKRFSLYAHYHWRMDRALKESNAAKLLMLAVAAQRDLEEYVGQRRRSHHERHESAVIELLRDYQGVPAWEAAVWLHVDTRWVRRQRVINGRDPVYGDIPDPDERRQHIVSLERTGMPQGRIAETVGITRQRVGQVLSGD